MYRICFASDFVIPHDLDKNNIWISAERISERHSDISEFKKAIGPYECFVLNLEAPFLHGNLLQKILKNGPSLKQHQSAIDLLKQLDVNLALLANNHINDYGLTGIEYTIEALEAAGIAQIGAGPNKRKAAAPYIINLPSNCQRAKLAILNYAEEEFGAIDSFSLGGYNPICYKQALNDVQHFNLDSEDVYSVAVVHGGAEFCDVPPPSLRKYAQFLADIGFDLVLCQHTHVIGCIEKYKHSTIVYGQGNFIFPRTVENENESHNQWAEGLLVTVELDQTGERVQFIKSECKSTSIVKFRGNLQENKDDASRFFNLLKNEEVYLESWVDWCRANRKRYSNIFFSFGLISRLFNKMFPPKLELLIKRRLKLVNYVRTASHSDVFKTLASLSLDSNNTKE